MARARLKNWPEGLHSIRGLASLCHLLVDQDGGVLLDAGLPCDTDRIRRVVEKAGLGPRDIRAILLTHGHLDHAGGLAWAKAWTGAPIYAHPAEQAHLEGTFPYSGAARWCGRLERVGRTLFGYTPVPLDHRLSDGDELPFWGGLKVIHLPGHTLGHCGFYSARHDLLFSGDLFARIFFRTQLSPRIFSSAPELLPASVAKARALGARWIVPGHYDEPDAAMLRRRFDEACERVRPRAMI